EMRENRVFRARSIKRFVIDRLAAQEDAGDLRRSAGGNADLDLQRLLVARLFQHPALAFRHVIALDSITDEQPVGNPAFGSTMIDEGKRAQNDAAFLRAKMGK